MVDRSRSVSTSIAFEFWSESSVVDSMDRFLMNFNMVIWWQGVMRFSSFKTPGQRLETVNDSWADILTVQNSSLSDHLLNMVLSLREDEKDVCNTALDNLGQFSLFIQHSAQDERQRIKHRVAREDPAEVVLGS